MVSVEHEPVTESRAEPQQSLPPETESLLPLWHPKGQNLATLGEFLSNFLSSPSEQWLPSPYELMKRGLESARPASKSATDCLHTVKVKI